LFSLDHNSYDCLFNVKEFGLVLSICFLYIDIDMMPSMDRFYDEQTEASQLKAEIVSKYFAAWANVIASQQTDRIGYLDLFCGPGRYEDGNPSTPLLVLEKAINHFNPKVCQKLVLTFNDSDPAKIAQLESEIDNFPDIHKLYFKPKTSTVRIGDRMVRAFENIVKMPTLSFIDPWGYKGLSLSLVRNLVKHWGCDSIFFFNYRRINPGIENPALQRPISLLFTEEVLNELRMKVMQKEPEEREKLIVSKVCDVFEDWGMGYVLPFPFKNKTGTRTAHYLIFVSKIFLVMTS
jgi:three-Cys-motif partner protein